MQEQAWESGRRTKKSEPKKFRHLYSFPHCKQKVLLPEREKKVRLCEGRIRRLESRKDAKLIRSLRA